MRKNSCTTAVPLDEACENDNHSDVMESYSIFKASNIFHPFIMSILMVP